MIEGYLIVAYLTAIAAWPVTMTLIGLSAGAALYTYEAQGDGRCPCRSVHAGGHRCMVV